MLPEPYKYLLSYMLIFYMLLILYVKYNKKSTKRTQITLKRTQNVCKVFVIDKILGNIHQNIRVFFDTVKCYDRYTREGVSILAVQEITL